MGEARVRVEGTGETPYFPLNFAVHPKLLKKNIKSLKKKKKRVRRRNPHGPVGKAPPN